MEFMDLVKDFGPLVGIVLFFIWRDWRREENLVNRVTKLETFINEVLVEMVKESGAIIATNTEQMRAISGLMGRCRGKQDG